MSRNSYEDDRAIFDRRNGPATTAAGDGLEGVYSAVLRTAPDDGECQVIIPALGLGRYRTVKCSPSYGGVVGDQVAVAFDEQKQGWLISPSLVSGGGGSPDLDGGTASTVFTAGQTLDAGGA
jgi:hypothetical protein